MPVEHSKVNEMTTATVSCNSTRPATICHKTRSIRFWHALGDAGRWTAGCCKDVQYTLQRKLFSTNLCPISYHTYMYIRFDVGIYTTLYAQYSTAVVVHVQKIEYVPGKQSPFSAIAMGVVPSSKQPRPNGYTACSSVVVVGPRVRPTAEQRQSMWSMQSQVIRYATCLLLYFEVFTDLQADLQYYVFDGVHDVWYSTVCALPAGPSLILLVQQYFKYVSDREHG